MTTKKHFPLVLLYAKIVFILMLLGTLLRLGFLSYNFQYFNGESWSDISLALLHGLRFDIATIGLCTAPWLLLSFLLYSFKLNKTFKILSFIYLPIPVIVMIATNVADTLYFPFTGRRSGPEVFSFSQDIYKQSFQLLQQYWFAVIILLLLTSLFCTAILYVIKHHKPTSTPWFLRLLMCIALFFITAIAIRSSLAVKPLKPSDAFNWPSPDTGHLVLNSTFSLIKQEPSELQPLTFFTTDDAAKKINRPQRINSTSTIKEDNVVIIILESFALEYLSQDDGTQGYAPFLETLIDKSLSFNESYANGRRSIDAIPSILAALPPLMSEPFITSGYLGVNVTGIANLLKQEDYQSWFFHGADNGSMYIDSMSRRFGFKQFSGLNEYPDKKDFDQNWGIYDGPFLNYMADSLNQMTPPFIAGVFTLSSHNPYPIPQQYQGKFAKGTLPIHPSIGYTDMALKNFFKKVETMPWYKDTLFVITADHTSITDNPRYQTPIGRHRVPILFFSPENKITVAQQNKIAQHTDIPATVLDYLGLLNKYQDKLLPFGSSLLQTEKGEAFFIESDRYYLINKEGILTADKAIKTFTFEPRIQQVDTLELRQKMIDRLKAKLQLHNNGMIKNSFKQTQ